MLELLSLLQDEHGVDPLSREFIFATRFEKGRNSTILPGDGSRRTVLSVLLYDLMDEDARARIFSGRFDLGSAQEVPGKEQTYASLLDELQQEPYFIRGRDSVDANHAFDTIKTGILKITGQKIDSFEEDNKLVTLKVVKLLYSIMRQQGKQSIFGLLTAPNIPRWAGMEFREAYPNEKNEENTWRIAELKEHLGMEMSVSRKKEIDITFDCLLGAVQSVERNLNCAIERFLGGAHGKGVVDRRRLSLYDSMCEGLTQFECRVPAVQRARRLDEALYTHISSLAFRHFAQVYPQVIAAGRYDLPVFPVIAQAARLRAHLQRDGSVEFVGNQVRLHNVRALITRYALQFREVVGAATGVELSEKPFKTVVDYAEQLLARVCIFEPGQVPLEQELLLTVDKLIAALCTIHVELHVFSKRKNYKPYWLGQKNQRGSLLGSLTKPATDAKVFEEHTQIWRIKLEWFEAANRGDLGIFEKRMALREILLGSVSEVAALQDVETIAQELARFLDLAKHCCMRVVNDWL